MDKLRGRIWQKAIDKGELEAYRRELSVISSRWFAGRVVIHVLSDQPLDRGFEPVEAELQDVYFSTLKSQQAA